MRINARIGLGIVVIVFCLALGYSTMSSYLVPYKKVGEVMDDPDQYKDKQVQINGKIVEGTLVQVPGPPETYEFKLADGNATMDVIYHGKLPLSFNINYEIVVVGRLTESGIFNATKLLVECPSRYSQ